ncbi:MAG TPA: hypothetical protein PK314_09995 [Deltaproteobacteria bacterium]|jgi:hypothetical protein|nr:hypothetical protein [Deltaproteobacteria bacterium]
MKLSLKNKILLIIGIAILGILGATGFYTWRSYVMNAQEKRQQETVRALLEKSKGREALAIIRAMKVSSDEEKSDQWLSLEIEALAQVCNIRRLLYLYSQHPLEILAHEQASLLVARALLQMQNMDLFNQVRDAWRSREKSPELWLALDADVLIALGRPDEALSLLESRSFEGKADCIRLTRIAILRAKEDLGEAWDILEEAYRADPHNADVRSFRGQVLEHLGKASMARVEYVAAHLCDPANPLQRDQLAEFYRRHGQYARALETWADGLSDSPFGYPWIKFMFWSKVAHPFESEAARGEPPSEDLKPLIVFMRSLPEKKFWDERSLQDNIMVQKLADSRQEVFWLRLLQALDEGSEAKALDLLRSSSFKDISFHQGIERALQIALVYRRWGVFVEPGAGKSDSAQDSGFEHQLFRQLDELVRKENAAASPGITVSRELDNLLKSREIFSAIFLAGGWCEAALRLHSLSVIPDDFPDWLAYGLTQALRYNRGNKAALDFAGRQKSSPSLNMLIAEILLAENRAPEASEILEPLARRNDPIGFRAAWMLCLAHLDWKEFEKSKQIATRNPALSKSIAGREILAKIALNTGNHQEADRLYSLLEKDSLEAKAYLARRAYERKDWEKARKLTEELMLYFPDMLELRENIEKISREEGRDLS